MEALAKAVYRKSFKKEQRGDFRPPKNREEEPVPPLSEKKAPRGAHVNRVVGQET
jgi:hypothetical protein